MRLSFDFAHVRRRMAACATVVRNPMVLRHLAMGPVSTRPPGAVQTE